MSTRSDIIAQRADGKWARIYCHHDGYLEGVGQTLHDHYRTQEKIDALMALGDISSLGEQLGEKHDFDWMMKMYRADRDFREDPEYQRLRRMCNVYGRDRGETGTEARVGDSLSAVWPPEDTWTEFTYVWADGRWWVGDPDTGSQDVSLLEDALAGKVALTPLIKTPFGITLGRHAAVKSGQ